MCHMDFSMCRAREATLPSCAGCRDTPAGGLGGTPSQQLSCTMSSQPFSTDRRATAYGDLHHQLLVSITPKQGFSKAKGFQLHHTSPPRAAAEHEEWPSASGFHPVLSQRRLAVAHCGISHPRRGCISSVCPGTPLQRSASQEQQGCPGSKCTGWRAAQGKAQGDTGSGWEQVPGRELHTGTGRWQRAPLSPRGCHSMMTIYLFILNL